MKLIINHKKICLLVIVCFLLFLGYCRDFIFKTLNALQKTLDMNVSYSTPPALSFLENYEYNTLTNIKWVLTFLFCIVYLALSVLTIQLLFHNRKYKIIIVAIYVALTVFSGILTGVGRMFPDTSVTMYEFARYIMGMLQSPVILMILVPIFKLSEKEKENIAN